MLYSEDQYSAVFRAADSNRDGFISLDDLMALIMEVDKTFPRDVVRTAFKSAKQRPPADKMDYEEFMEAMRQLNAYMMRGVGGGKGPILYGAQISMLHMYMKTPRFQRWMYEEFFRETDTDQDGFITYTEFLEMTRKFDMEYLAKTVKLEFQKANTRGDGYMSMKEFIIAMGFKWHEGEIEAKKAPPPVKKPPPKKKEPKFALGASLLRSIFNSMDQDGDGVLGREELKGCFEQLGQPMDDKEIDAIFAASNKDGNNDSLTFDEFVSSVMPTVHKVEDEEEEEEEEE